MVTAVCTSVHEKQVGRGGPDGGDGGPGGDVVLVADPDLRDLSAFRAKQRFKRGRGEPGPGALKHGATGETVELRAPIRNAGARPGRAGGVRSGDAGCEGSRRARGGRPGNVKRTQDIPDTPGTAVCGDGPPG